MERVEEYKPLWTVERFKIKILIFKSPLKTHLL